MVLYMLRDGMTEGVVARLMGCDIRRVIEIVRYRRRALDQAQVERWNRNAKHRRAAVLARLWEEKRA